MNPALLLLGMVGAWALTRTPRSAGSPAPYKPIPVPVVMPAFKIPAAATPYLSDFHRAELLNDLPAGLLVRMAKQESNFDKDAYNAGSGAAGIMQIVPRWHPGVNPWDPVASIYYAGAYIRDLNFRFQSWELALAAYNFGLGNVNKIDGDSKDKATINDIQKMPKETRDYVAQISRDVMLT